MYEEKILQEGDLVRLAKTEDILGIVVYKHPTKEVVRIYWPNELPTWESCSRLEIISSCDFYEEYLPR